MEAQRERRAQQAAPQTTRGSVKVATSCVALKLASSATKGSPLDLLRVRRDPGDRRLPTTNALTPREGLQQTPPAQYCPGEFPFTTAPQGDVGPNQAVPSPSSLMGNAVEQGCRTRPRPDLGLVATEACPGAVAGPRAGSGAKALQGEQGLYLHSPRSAPTADIPGPESCDRPCPQLQVAHRYSSSLDGEVLQAGSSPYARHLHSTV